MNGASFEIENETNPELSPETLARAPRGKWARTLSEILDVLVSLFLRRGSARDDAVSDAHAVALELAKFFGGRALYVPNGKHLRIALRDAEIYARADGTNADELARQFEISVRRVQQIVIEQRELRRTECRSAGVART